MGVKHINNPYRKIYREHYGEIPKGYHIHHIDGNPLNNNIENLIAVTPEEHAKLHNHEGVAWASEAGKIGGPTAYNIMDDAQKKEWHLKGGLAASEGRGNRLYGKGTMRKQGAQNIKHARMNSKKYTCSLCECKPMDGGNISKHLQFIHGIEKENAKSYRVS